MKKLMLLFVLGVIFFTSRAQSFSIDTISGGKKVLLLGKNPCLFGSRDSILLIEKQFTKNKCQQPDNKKIVALVDLEPRFKCECYSVFKKNNEGYWEFIQGNTDRIWMYDLMYPN